MGKSGKEVEKHLVEWVELERLTKIPISNTAMNYLGSVICEVLLA